MSHDSLRDQIDPSWYPRILRELPQEVLEKACIDALHRWGAEQADSRYARLNEAGQPTTEIDKARHAFAYLGQSRVWVPKGGAAVAIADMGGDWRRNAANWLLRRAALLADYYTAGEAGTYTEPSDAMVELLSASAEERSANPTGWLKGTALYLALVAGRGTEVRA